MDRLRRSMAAGLLCLAVCLFGGCQSQSPDTPSHTPADPPSPNIPDSSVSVSLLETEVPAPSQDTPKPKPSPAPEPIPMPEVTPEAEVPSVPEEIPQPEAVPAPVPLPQPTHPQLPEAPTPPENPSEPEAAPQPEDPPSPEVSQPPEEIPQPEEPQPPEQIPEPEVASPPEEPQQPEEIPEPAPNHTLYILMYHHVVPDGTNCNDWTITTSRLRDDLRWLSEQGYTFLLPRELAAGAPLPEKAVLVTFDDGYTSNYELAYPLLQEFQAKAVISVITKNVEDGMPGRLTWDMCREMSASGLVEFGSHTHNSHSLQETGICRLPDETQEEYEERIFSDLQTSIDLIKANVGTEVTFFAYPNGKTDPWADGFIQENFSVSVTTRHGPANLQNGLHKMPRHNITVSTPVGNYLP